MIGTQNFSKCACNSPDLGVSITRSVISSEVYFMFWDRNFKSTDLYCSVYDTLASRTNLRSLQGGKFHFYQLLLCLITENGLSKLFIAFPALPSARRLGKIIIFGEYLCFLLSYKQNKFIAMNILKNWKMVKYYFRSGRRHLGTGTLRLPVMPAWERCCTDHVSHGFRALHFLQYNMHIWNTFGILLSKQSNYQCTF